MSGQNHNGAPAPDSAEAVTRQYIDEKARQTVEKSDGIAFWDGGVIGGRFLAEVQARRAQEAVSLAGELAITEGAEQPDGVVVFPATTVAAVI